MPNSQIVPKKTLNDLQTGDFAHITVISGASSEIRHLFALGLVRGAKIHVINRNTSTLIVRVFDSTIAINSNIASHIGVKL